MAEEALAFCSRNMKVRTVVDTQTGERRDVPEYPLVAIREAILNALIHRDYSLHTEGTPIQIDFFTDRLEIHSPGALYGRMTVEQLGQGRPDLRNPTLAVMAETLTQAENRYSGIPTMRREMAAMGLPEPVFENRRNEFVVTFYNHSQNDRPAGADELPDNAARLLEFCRIPRTRREIANFLGIKTVFYVTQRYITPLLDAQLLTMTLPETPKSRKQKFRAAVQR